MPKLVATSTASKDGTVAAQTQWIVSAAGRFQVVEPNNEQWSKWLAQVPESVTGDFVASVPLIR